MFENTVENRMGEGAYERLLEPRRAELRAHCRRLLGSGADAEDAVQEALIRAWRALPAFEGRASLRTWLYRIATNASLDQIRRRPRDPVPLESEPAAVEVADDSLERRESLRLALEGLRGLPARQRSVLVMRGLLGYSAAETAEALGTTPAAVNSALQRARATAGSWSAAPVS